MYYLDVPPEDKALVDKMHEDELDDYIRKHIESAEYIKSHDGVESAEIFEAEIEPTIGMRA